MSFTGANPRDNHSGRNDSAQYYKTMILANLDLARSVEYDRKTFIVQA